ISKGKPIFLPSYLYSSLCAIPAAPGLWIKRTGESLVPKALCRNCLDDDLPAWPISAVATKAGGVLAVVSRPSGQVDVEEEEGDKAEAGGTKGTFRVCMLMQPLQMG
uniref:Uncharacterized protein n=1 Tax=Piliocolobus tephrosceles TaxID=591936 RepID=A0A8C9H3A5_9PRIM